MVKIKILKNKFKLKKGLTIIEMGITILLISIIMGILFSLIRNFSIFKTTQGETETLKDLYSFTKRTAIKSGQVVFMEFNLDQNTYKIYRKERTEKEVKDKILIERNLFFTNRIVALKVVSKKIENGVVTITFYPMGINDEAIIYIGSGNTIQKSIIYPKYGNYAIIKNGEFSDEDHSTTILTEDKGENF